MGKAKYCECKNTYSIDCGNVPCKKHNPYLDPHYIGPLTGQGSSSITHDLRQALNITYNDPRETYKMIEHINLLPGAGEYLYSTEVVSKQTSQGQTIEINNNTNTGVADASVKLDQLLASYPNLKGLSLGVSWYGDVETDAMTIAPRQDRHTNILSFSQDWSVGSYDRNSAPLASLVYNEQNVEGTPGDDSLVQFVDLCISKGLKVMLYPTLMMDTLNKGWRGSILFDGTQSSLDNFFSQYTSFIRHYSQLFGGTDKLDKFVIGTEMVSLTQLQITGAYEGVNKLKQLASEVQSDFGADSTKISYAADWSEYHSNNGDYNLDPLWTDSNIDEIGLNYFMPVTDFMNPKSISYDDIVEGFESGEGWDHYYSQYNDQNSKVDYLTPGGSGSWKNVFGWWNEDRPSTGWTSQMKPLFFSEYGYPSINGATNQPDKYISELPRLSSGEVDIDGQREAIAAFNQYWDSKTEDVSGFAEQRYIHAADIRPYPQYPDSSDVWSDTEEWAAGFRIDGKLVQAKESDIPQPNSAELVVGYFPDYRPITVLSNGIDWNSLDVLLYFGAVANNDGSISLNNESHFDQAIAQAQANNTAVSLAIGGYGLSDGFSTIAADATLRLTFANACVALCQSKGLQGINIDWEYPSAGEEDNVVLFFKELYTRMNNNGFNVTSAINASSWGIQVWKAEAFDYMDYVYVMSYDGSGDHHSSYRYMIQTLRNVTELGVPNEKILGGVPFYTRGTEVLTFKQLIDSVSSEDDKKEIFENSEYNGMTYNGQDIIQAKANYIKKNGFAGLMIWEIGQDSYDQYSLLNVVRESLND